MRRVNESAEFRRIDALPRRAATAVASLEHLKKPGCALDFLPDDEHGISDQRRALIELVVFGKLLGGIGVGKGKTLVSLLAPTIIPSKRPLLLVPASVKRQTIDDALPKFKPHFKIRDDIKLMSYSELQLLKNKNILYDLQPDLIVSDEAHMLKRHQSARTSRFRNYLKQHPETKVIPLSGTLVKRSLRDYWFLALVALKSGTPLPMSQYEFFDWADAIDEDVRPENRCAPGALTKWSNGNPSPAAVRAGYLKRLQETPGVILSGEGELGTSLEVLDYPFKLSKHAAAFVDRVRDTWIMPNDDIITDHLAFYRCMRELSQGFFYDWEWKGGIKDLNWLKRRKDWRSFVQEKIKYSRGKYDSELGVARACLSGELPDASYVAWKAVEKVNAPKQKTVWLFSDVLAIAGKWISETERGIVWTEHLAVGEAFARSGIRYFGAGESQIVNHRATCAASIDSHGVGKNLQWFNRNLVLCPPSDGATWEQLLGRTHRHGQLADEVKFDVLRHTDELVDALDKARKNAEYIEQTTGNKQKLLWAVTSTLTSRSEKAPNGNPSMISKPKSSTNPSSLGVTRSLGLWRA